MSAPNPQPHLRALLETGQRIAAMSSLSPHRQNSVVWQIGDGTKGLVCPHADQVSSAHIALALHPLKAEMEAQWDAWTHALFTWAPYLREHPIRIVHRQWNARAPEPDGRQKTLSEFELSIQDTHTPFPSSMAFQDTMDTYLSIVEGIPRGPHAYTVMGTMPPRGGCPYTLSRAYATASAADAARLWVAEHALKHNTYPITYIRQNHDVQEVVASIAHHLPKRRRSIPTFPIANITRP